jgi:hypothetical protein
VRDVLCVVVETAEIDHRRSYYRGVLSQWAENLYELDEHPTYRLLAAGDMSGATGDQTNATMAGAPQLWAWLGEFRSHLDVVDALVEDRGVFRNNDADAALLLGGASISVSRSSIPSTAPQNVLHQLGIDPADPDRVVTTCDGLISLFRSVYEPVRDVVARVDDVWRDLLPRIDAATVSLERAKTISARLDVRVPEVALATQRLEAVRASVADDPLSLSGNVGPDLDALVEAAADAAGRLDRAHGSLDDDLAVTDALLAQLRVLRARAAAAYSEAVAKVLPAGELVRIPSTSVIDGTNGLAHRAAQIVGGTETGTRDWQRDRTDVDRWHHAAGRLRSQLERGLRVNRAPIEQRNELRGLLRAYRVKASMSRGLPAEIADIGQRAHDELYTSPSNIAEAKALIDELAAELATYSGRA